MSMRKLLLVGVAASATLWIVSPSVAYAAPPGHTTRAVQDGEWPYGSLDVVEAVGGSIHVTGWAIDPDGPAASYVEIDVDFRSSHTVLAAEWRDDVGYHGFDYIIDAPDGRHTVCATALDYDHAAPDAGLGCREVTVHR